MLLSWPTPLLMCSLTTEILRYVHCYLLQIPHGRHTKLSKLQHPLFKCVHVCVFVCACVRDRERERERGALMATYVLECILMHSVNALLSCVPSAKTDLKKKNEQLHMNIQTHTDVRVHIHARTP